MLLITLAIFDILYLCLVFIDSIGKYQGACTESDWAFTGQVFHTYHYQDTPDWYKILTPHLFYPGKVSPEPCLANLISTKCCPPLGHPSHLLNIHDDLHRCGALHGRLLSIFKVDKYFLFLHSFSLSQDSSPNNALHAVFQDEAPIYLHLSRYLLLNNSQHLQVPRGRHWVAGGKSHAEHHPAQGWLRLHPGQCLGQVRSFRAMSLVFECGWKLCTFNTEYWFEKISW